MTDFQYTIGTSSSGFQLTTTTSGRPPSTPKGLFATRAVETRAGFLGQVIVDGEIVWESDPYKGYRSGEDAQREANKYIVDRFKALLAPPDTTSPVIEGATEEDD